MPEGAGPDPLSPAQRRAFLREALEQKKERLNAVLALHRVEGGGEYCVEDGFHWPCRTYRAATDAPDGACQHCSGSGCVACSAAHDWTMPHDIRHASDDPQEIAGCPPNCPARLAAASSDEIEEAVYTVRFRSPLRWTVMADRINDLIRSEGGEVIETRLERALAG